MSVKYLPENLAAEISNFMSQQDRDTVFCLAVKRSGAGFIIARSEVSMEVWDHHDEMKAGQLILSDLKSAISIVEKGRR